VDTSNTFAVWRNAGKPYPNGTDAPAEIRDTLGKNIFFNSSRNRQLDDQIKPGPYKEVLPCDDVCYEVVQSCPAVMQFSCPLPGDLGFNISYGTRGDGGNPDMCNYPGQSRSIRSLGTRILSPLCGSWALAVLFALLFAAI
jgi:calcium channel MID1